MRIILSIAAVFGAVAAGAVADAQSWGVSTGRGAGPHITPGAPAPTPGTWQARPVRDRRDKPDRGRARFIGFGAGFGVGGAYRTADPYGDGFFAGGGGEIRMRGGRPHYDYDRSYPYEFASAAGAGPERADEERPAGPPPRCAVEYGVRVCRGW